MQVILMGFELTFTWGESDFWTAMAGNGEAFVPFIFLYYKTIWVYINTHNCPPTDARGEVALMLPPPADKQGRTLVRASIESKRAFIDVNPVSNLPLDRNVFIVKWPQLFCYTVGMPDSNNYNEWQLKLCDSETWGRFTHFMKYY